MDQAALKWRDLAERRRAHFIELYQSGRWKHYFDTEDDYRAGLREAIKAASRWAKIAPKPEDVRQQAG